MELAGDNRRSVSVKEDGQQGKEVTNLLESAGWEERGQRKLPEESTSEEVLLWL